MTRHNEPTVLIVDDDEAVRDSLSMVLRAAGRPVETFASAEEFIERGGTSRTGCLVLDVRMPGMSGLELQEYLAERNLPLPIVFLTGHGDIPMAVRAVRRGAWEFLQKPVDDGQLLAAVDAAARGNGVHDLLIHPLRTGILEIGFERRPRGDPPPARRAGLDDSPGTVAD